jgi:thiol-disulfide isomerase/thioredoxin
MIIFLAVIIVVFGAIALLTNKDTKEKSAGNPYNKDILEPETVDQLNDPNYQNIITADDLQKKIANKKDVTVYFYSPTCSHCKETTPVVAPLAKAMKIDLVQYNLLEFEQGWDDYAIEYTPTIVQFKAGKETARIVGFHTEAEFRPWFEENTLK